MKMEYGEKINAENSDFFFLIQNDRLEECRIHLNEFPDALNKRNKKQETALHIASKNVDLTELLLNNGADINAKNYWGQTPLHYATQARSVEVIRRLLQDKQIDANFKDANGYTALHYIFTSFQGDGINREDCLDCLLDAGVDINSTTNTGKSIFHQIACLYDPFQAWHYFRDIFSKNPNVNLFLKDLEGKNFLQIWSHFQKDDLVIFDIIAKWKGKEIVTQLLNEKNVSGVSPFMNFLGFTFTSTEAVDILVDSYGALIDSTDNMKNTALHVLSSIGGKQFCEKIELLIQKKINVNAKNIFGQTAVSLLICDDTFEVFKKHENVKWDNRDRWDRTLFSDSICNKEIHGRRVCEIFQKYKDCIGMKDSFNSTPLHLAAYSGDSLKVKLLLRLTPNKMTVVDGMGDTPAATALRHGEMECYKLLEKNVDHKRFLPPKNISLSKLQELRNLRELLKDFPEDSEEYFNYLLATRHITNSNASENDEDNNIIQGVNELVIDICALVASYDSRFKMSVFRTGSTADGTKVGRLNEFDFALCLQNLCQNSNVEIPANAESQFVCLRLKENAISDYKSFSDEKRYFVALPFLHYLFRYLKRALKEEKLWKRGNISMRPNEAIRVSPQKTVFNFIIYWNGSKNKKLKISIDLVPVVHKTEWWPTFITRKPALSDNVVKAGCFVILQTKINEFDKEWTIYTPMNDNINATCKRQNESSEEQSENNEHLLLRVSVAPAEIALMRSMPEQIRKAYSLAKIVLMKDVCPGINIDKTPLNLGSSVNELRYQSIDNIDHIKSYWLKNCTFYVAKEFYNKEESVLDITRRIYGQLLKFATLGKLEVYLFPESDIWAPEKDVFKSRTKIRKMLFQRKVCIDAVLWFLEKPFPADSRQWVLDCEDHYKPFNEDLEKETLSLS